MKSVIFVFVVMFSFIFVGCDFQTADHIVTDSNGNEKIEDGYLGGICLKGDVCIEKEAECVKGFCIEKETEVADDEVGVTTCKTEENVCKGLKMYFDTPLGGEANIASWGTADEGCINTIWPAGKTVVEFSKCTCSAVAYSDDKGTPLKPTKCEGYRSKGDGTYSIVVCAPKSQPKPNGDGVDWVCPWDCN